MFSQYIIFVQRVPLHFLISPSIDVFSPGSPCEYFPLCIGLCHFVPRKFQEYRGLGVRSVVDVVFAAVGHSDWNPVESHGNRPCFEILGLLSVVTVDGLVEETESNS